DPAPGRDAQFPAWLEGVGIQHPAPAAAPAGDGALGEPAPGLQGVPDERSWTAHGPSRVRSRTGPQRTALARRRLPESRARGRDGRDLRSEPRRDPAPGLQPPRVPDREHRLRGDRGRYTTDEPHALSALLPREEDLLPARRGHLPVR